MSIVPWIITACWAIFILFWTVSSFGIKRDISRSPWQRLWWLRVTIVTVVLGWLWATSLLGRLTHYGVPANVLGIHHLSPAYAPLAAIGALLCVLGIALAIWARVHLGRNWSPAPALKEGHELVTSGPYRLIRHPIYTGILMALFGTALASTGWFLIFFIVSIVFIRRVYVEEGLMMKQFLKQYPEYKQRTWALVPFVW